MAIKEFFLCCGAGVDLGATTCQKFLDEKKPIFSMLSVYSLGFIFTDKPIEGFGKICEGLYYIHRDISWCPPDDEKWGKISPKEKFITAPYRLPYITPNQNVLGINLIANFPYSIVYDIRDLITENVKIHEHEDSIVVLNMAQASLFEGFLLDVGFKVINRTVNPKHGSNIVLYHRPPGELTLET